MKVAIYPGSFNPWHKGHEDILLKALQVFDEVVIAIGVNPEKPNNGLFPEVENAIGKIVLPEGKDVRVTSFRGLLVDEIADFNRNYENPIQAVVRGIRNGTDLDYEKTQQYWNEDLGILVPTVCFICNRNYTHISSSAIRAVKAIKK